MDRQHRIGKVYFYRIKREYCKSITIRFTTFCHGTLLNMAKKERNKQTKKEIKGYKVRLDLTKKHYSILFLPCRCIFQHAVTLH